MSCARDDKIRELRENTPTIFAPNCWGGITYHHLGLQFCSPLINMHMHHDEYIRFLRDPHYYLSQELRLKEMYIDDTLERPFPVATLDDVSLWMNHYADFDEAKEIWERRKQRVKWDNLFVMLFEDDPKLIDQFLELPYEHKVCFVPWETHIEGLIPVPYKKHERLMRYPFWEIINNLAMGDFVMYDDVELLHDCRYVKTGDILRDNQIVSKYQGDTKRDTKK